MESDQWIVDEESGQSGQKEGDPNGGLLEMGVKLELAVMLGTSSGGTVVGPSVALIIHLELSHRRNSFFLSLVQIPQYMQLLGVQVNRHREQEPRIPVETHWQRELEFGVLLSYSSGGATVTERDCRR